MLKYGSYQFSVFKIILRNFSGKVKKTAKKKKNKQTTESSYEATERFGPSFYGVPCIELAKNLLGQTIVRRLNNVYLLRCRIVETEAYLGVDDKASHASQVTSPGRRTASVFKDPGTTCVTSVYGVHLVLSISSLETGSSVLVRSAEPISGAEEMRRQRAIYFRKQNLNPLFVNKSIRLHRLCSGPARLASALGVSAKFDGENLCTSEELWIERGPETVDESQIVECPRIGLSDLVGEWAFKPLRFYILGHTSVSKRNKPMERELQIATGVISKDGEVYLK